jgi:molybdopterin/thiamine biosynthesis adenylyltransferase
MFPCVSYQDNLDRASRSISLKATRYIDQIRWVNYWLTHHCQVVVLCGVSYAKQLEINDWTHANDIPFIAAETRGLFG